MQTGKPKIIECCGTPYETGRQYGGASKDSIIKSVDFMFNSLKNGYFRASRDNVLKASAKYLENVKAFDSGAVEWIDGIARGAGISFEESFALKCYLEVSMNYPSVSGMCTSFALTGAATENGVTILGQNIDWHPEATVDLLLIKNTGGLDQLSLCLLGTSYYYLNSAGVGCCSNLTLSPMGPVKAHIPLSIYLRKAMGEDSLEGAMNVLEKTARGVGYYHLADKNGQMAGIESTYDDYRIINPEDNVLVHANHYETAEYKKNDLAYTYIKDSFGRSKRLRELVSEYFGCITPEHAMDFLRDHAGHPDSICRHVNGRNPGDMASESRASIVMVPEERKVYIAFGPPCENPYYEYSVRVKNL